VAPAIAGDAERTGAWTGADAGAGATTGVGVTGAAAGIGTGAGVEIGFVEIGVFGKEAADDAGGACSLRRKNSVIVS
jgi:hypothetical protein